MARIFAPRDGQIGKREKEHMGAVRAIASQGMKDPAPIPF